MGRLALALLCSAGALAVSAGTASTAILVAQDASAPTLRVDANGFAQVGWKSKDKVRHTLLIPPQGRVVPGGRLPGRNVSKPASEVTLPYRRVIRVTPDGTFWALQAWQVVKGGPVDLRFSRWHDAPTVVTAGTTCCHNEGETLAGTASFQGQPLFGTSPTTAGKSVRIFVYVDCFDCGGGVGWSRLLGVPPKAPDGSYSVFIRPEWLAARYRVTLAGPNLGWTYAPDASAIIETAVQNSAVGSPLERVPDALGAPVFLPG